MLNEKKKVLGCPFKLGYAEIPILDFRTLKSHLSLSLSLLKYLKREKGFGSC